MEKSAKSLTISQLILKLQDVRADLGNLEVVLSSDPEGNSFGTLDSRYSIGVDDTPAKHVIIYPVEQFTDFE